MVVLLITLIIVGFVARLTGIAPALDVNIALHKVLRAALTFINIDVTMLFVMSRRLTIALNPDVAVLLDPSRSSITLDPDLSVDPLRSVLRSFVFDVDVDVGFLLGRRLGPLRLLDRLEGSQVTEDFAQARMRNLQFLLPVFKLLFLAQEPVNAVPDTNTTAILDIAGDALRMWRDVLQRAAYVSHGAIDPFGLLRVGFEGVMDLADREKATDFVKVGAYAADDAHVDCIGRADVTKAFGFVHKFAELVGTAQSGRGGADGEEFSFRHVWC